MTGISAPLQVSRSVYPAAGGWHRAEGSRVLQRLHLTSRQRTPPLGHCPIVGDGCAGPPKPSMRIDHAAASARIGLADGFASRPLLKDYDIHLMIHTL